MQLSVIVALLQSERVEIGVEMTAHAIGADHHQRANAIAGGALQLIADRRRCRGRDFREYGRGGGDGLRRAPISVERAHPFVLGRGRPILASQEARAVPFPPARGAAPSPAKKARQSGPTLAGSASKAVNRCSR